MKILKNIWRRFKMTTFTIVYGLDDIKEELIAKAQLAGYKVPEDRTKITVTFDYQYNYHNYVGQVGGGGLQALNNYASGYYSPTGVKISWNDK